MGSAVLSGLLLFLPFTLTRAEVGVASGGGADPCPELCVCETRPWYSSQSVFHQARTVDCNQLHLHSFPANVSADTQVLLLQSNNVSSITTELQSLTNLTELDLSQNHFNKVSSMGLSSLDNLVTLYMEENHIEELEDLCLSNLSSLEELYINHNRISSIGPKAFAGLSNLLRLHLNSNRLVAIDSRWFESLPSLEILMIGENPILGLAERNFLPLARLHSLVLAGMGLVSIPPTAFVGLDYLESLSFYGNRLRSVPREALSVLHNLKFLDLNKNPISRIRQGDFENLLHLEELSLNNMEELLMVEREAFQNLPQISKLELSNNPQLSSIHPRAFSLLPSLRALLLHSDQLRLLPGGLLSSLPALERVSLYSNPLRCDCVSSWGGRLGLLLLEPSLTLCSSPPHLIGRELREVVAAGGGGADSCPPHIPPQALPSSISVSAGQPIRLQCWADADPAPQLYWLTPTGEQVGSESRAAPITSEGRGLSRKRSPCLVAPGALLVEQAQPSDAGVYTCVARSPEGADTRSVSVSVGSPGPDASLLLLAKVVRAQWLVLEWKLLPGGGAPSVGRSQQDAPTVHATVHVHSPQISYTAEVPADLQEFNVTHLLPATEYRVCLSLSSPPAPPALVLTSCLDVTTTAGGPLPGGPLPGRRGVALAAGVAVAALSLMALLAVHTGRRARRGGTAG